LVFRNKEGKATHGKNNRKFRKNVSFLLCSVHQSADIDGPIDSDVTAFHKKQEQASELDTVYQIGN
jgi:Holliday junction resolvase RusA-like endonuclease